MLFVCYIYIDNLIFYCFIYTFKNEQNNKRTT